MPNPWTINSNLSGGAHLDTDLDNIHIKEDRAHRRDLDDQGP